ncbi:VOC family protein [Clostridium sp. 'deep sea']|uniref:VOC family protein n=1 Tax=Clostridium sp. 'deep sea' TaxID=2779445 RepID=UPI00189672F9|nr:VOC family protein [Clostridium sp. 'deep sea']QOR36677.1 VOC family protein [Clostridium sp. 'deep sea']
MKFEHIGIKVLNLPESIKFYTQVLDCSVINKLQKQETQLVFLDAHGVTIELIYKPKNSLRTIGPVEHLAFKVDNFEKKVQELKDLNIKFDGPARNTEIGKIIFFRGPNNERIEILGL